MVSYIYIFTDQKMGENIYLTHMKDSILYDLELTGRKELQSKS